MKLRVTKQPDEDGGGNAYYYLEAALILEDGTVVNTCIISEDQGLTVGTYELVKEHPCDHEWTDRKDARITAAYGDASGMTVWQCGKCMMIEVRDTDMASDGALGI